MDFTQMMEECQYKDLLQKVAMYPLGLTFVTDAYIPKPIKVWQAGYNTRTRNKKKCVKFLRKFILDVEIRPNV